MIALAVAFSLLRAAPAADAIREFRLTRPGSDQPVALLRDILDPIDPPHLSPKKFGVPAKPWEFQWLSMTYVRQPNTENHQLRFRIFSQERKETDDLAPKASRMLATMWDDLSGRLKLDHAERYNGRIIDVYLCWGGKAGGEQLFDVATEKDRQTGQDIRKNVNTIYIYQVHNLPEPMEMAREVAHEYGHAVLPAIGGYSAPEGWANGYLGEKLFLYWLRDGMAKGTLAPEDAMGATPDQVNAWLEKNADPLVLQAAQNFPSVTWLKDPTAKGMDHYLGLALLASQVLPNSVFGRSLLLTGSTEAKDYPAALILATEEPDEYEIKIPKLLADQPIWLPTGKGKITGGKILQLKDGWAQVKAPEGTLTVTNKR